MKKVVSIYILSLIGIFYAQAESINVDEVIMEKGGTTSIAINLDNIHADLVSFQMDLYLPNNFKLNKSDCSLSSRFDDSYELTIGKQADGAYRLTATSFTLMPISETSGTIINLSMTAPSNVGEKQISIKNIRFITIHSERLDLSDVSFNIFVKDYQKLILGIESLFYGDKYDLPKTTLQEYSLITWTVEDTSVATIDGYVLTAVGPGRTKLKAEGPGTFFYFPLENEYEISVYEKSINRLTLEPIIPNTYTGLEQTPAVTLIDGETTLTSGVDYTVSYSNNINAGTSTVYVQGKGNYTGGKTINFTIGKAPLIVTAKSYTIVQGNPLPFFEADYSGFQNDETSSVFTTQPVFNCSAIDSSTAGTYDIHISEAEAENYEFTYVDGLLTIRLIGDVNGDGELTEEDIETIVDYIMGKAPNNFDKEVADTNDDGYINAADIVAIINYLKENK